MCSLWAQAVELPKVGVSLPKGTPVVILLQAMHMHPDYWDEPEAFDPGRWIRAEDTSAMRTASDNGTRSAFIPFLVSPKLLYRVSLLSSWEMSRAWVRVYRMASGSVRVGSWRSWSSSLCCTHSSRHAPPPQPLSSS